MKKIKNIFSNLPKKTIAIIGGVAIVLALGITSTIKSYNEKTHGDYVIASDSVYSKLSGTTDLTLTSLAKETDSVARARTDNVITFVVKGKNTRSDMEVNYEVQLDEGETVSGKTRLDPSNIKFDLVETIDGTDTTVVDAETFSSLNSTGIYTNQIAHGTSDEDTRTYTLRVWVSSSSRVTTKTLANSYISVHVKIAGSFYQDPTIIPSCPGCVYTNNRRSYDTTWDFFGNPPTVLTSNDYEEDYQTVITNSGKNYFLGLKLNGSNQITNAYACGVYNSHPFCIEGTSDGSKYSANSGYLYEIYGEYSDSTHTGCRSFGSEVKCYGAVDAYANSSGYVGTRDSGGYYCYVHGFGFLSCVEGGDGSEW